MTQLDFAAHQSDELLGGEAGIGNAQCPGRGRGPQKFFDLGQIAFGSGLPEYLAEHREAADLADNDAVQRDRVRRQQQFEKTAAERRQRGTDIAGIEFAGREAGEIALAFAADDRAEQFLLAGEMGIDRRLRHAGLARDRVHADRAEAAREKGPLGRGENAFGLAAAPPHCARSDPCCAGLHSVLRPIKPAKLDKNLSALHLTQS